MYPRAPVLPAYPAPWEGQAAKEPTWQILRLGGSEDLESISWNRVIVSMPTLIYPFRSDDMTGFPVATDLGWLDVCYTPENPFRESSGHIEADTASFFLKAFPSMRGGACYLWAPGEWWVRCKCNHTGTGMRIPFLFTPVPDRSFLEAYLLGFSSAQRPLHSSAAMLAGATAKLWSVQDLLSGVRAITFQIPNVGVHFRWGSTGAVAMIFGASIQTFSGATLALADGYFQNTTAANQTVRAILYH